MDTRSEKEKQDHNNKIGEFTEHLFNGVSELTRMSVMTFNSNNKSDAIYIGCSAALGALHNIAQMIGHNSDEPSREAMRELALKAEKGDKEAQEKCKDVARKRVNHNTTLFAAILAHKVCPQVQPDDNIAAEMSAAVVLDAMETFEKATGYKPDKYLDPDYAKQARDAEVGSAEVLSDFLKTRPKPPVSKNLN